MSLLSTTVVREVQYRLWSTMRRNFSNGKASVPKVDYLKTSTTGLSFSLSYDVFYQECKP